MLGQAPAPNDPSTQQPQQPQQPTGKPNDRGVKLHALVVPKTKEEERAENLTAIVQSIDRYNRLRVWLDEMTAKYKNDVGEDENHILGRHYAEVRDAYEKSAIPLGDKLVEDFEDFGDIGPAQGSVAMGIMLVDSQHLDLILDGLRLEERKWLRNHAKDRVEPGVVVVVK